MFAVRRVFKALLGGGMLVAAMLIVWQLACCGALVLLGTTISCAVVYRYPVAVFATVVTGIAAQDLTPWTGQFFVNEFDVWMLANLGVALLRATTSRSRRWPQPDTILFALVLASVVVSGVLELTTLEFPFEPGNAYDHPLNTIRAPRGLLYGAITFWLATQMKVSVAAKQMSLGWGAVTGLILVVAAVLNERWRFSGVFNFDSEFRVTGPFSEMHTGGAYLDSFLVMTMPLVFLVWRRHVSWMRQVFFALLLLGSLYCVLATLSRAPVLVVALQVVAALVLLGISQPRTRMPILVAGPILLLLAGFVVSQSNPLMKRFAASVNDFRIRTSHWGRVLSECEQTAGTQWFGQGPGTFALLSRQSKRGDWVPEYSHVHTPTRHTLVLRGGEPLYFDQRVAVASGKNYRLVIRGRRLSDGGSLTVALVEKNLLSSNERSVLEGLLRTSPLNEWTTIQRELPSRGVGALRGGARWKALAIGRPVSLSLWSRGVVELDSLQLLDASGKDLVRNGDFSRGHRHWWWTGDNHRSWHAFCVIVHVLIEYGWIGLLTFGGYFLWHSVRAAWDAAKRPHMIPFAVSLLGFAVMGSIDSMIDSPRILLLLVVVCQSGRVSEAASCDKRVRTRSLSVASR